MREYIANGIRITNHTMIIDIMGGYRAHPDIN